YPLPYAYLQKLRGLRGVVAAASWTWYGGSLEVEKGPAFPSFAPAPDGIAELFPDFRLGPEAVEAFRRHRDGAIVGVPTLRSYGWKVGDRVTLHGDLYPVDLEFQIVGVIDAEMSQLFLFQREYLEQALRESGGALDSATLLYVRVDDRARIDPLRAEIDALFRNAPAQTLTQTEKEYFKNLLSVLDGFVAITIAVTGLVGLCIVFIAANTARL